MTTFICGYWKIKQNVKNSYENHYKKLIPKTLNILRNCKIIFFYDNDEVLSEVKKHIQTNNIIYKKISIDSLETYNLSYDYLETCKLQDNVSLRKINTHKEKGLVHYQREYKKSGEDSFRKVFTVWTSKLFLVNKTIDENPFNTNYFAWIDISCSRFDRNNKLYTKFYFPTKLFHFGNGMKYYGVTLPINASFLIAHKNIWKKLIPLYKKQLQLSKNSKYAHDEETILYLIWKDNKNLFCDIKNNKKILFMHFHKSYGTSLISTFKLKFKLYEKNMNGNPWVENSHVILFNEMNNNELINWYNSINCDLVCLEWNFFTNFNSLHSKLFNFITILRDPYDRFISAYKIYHSRNNNVNIWEFCSKKLNNFYILGKMQKCVNQKSYPIIINEFNYYTKMINGLGNTHNAKINQDHYQNAINILKTFDVKTDVEIKNNNYNFNKFGIDKIIKTNVNKNKKNIVIDNKFKEYFIKQNSYDYKIYNFFLSKII